jgi:hypothetical protein
MTGTPALFLNRAFVAEPAGHIMTNRNGYATLMVSPEEEKRNIDKAGICENNRDTPFPKMNPEPVVCSLRVLNIRLLFDRYYPILFKKIHCTGTR